MAAAFLIEFPFYLLPGFDAPRHRLARCGKKCAALLLTASAIAPWLAYSLATGEAHFTDFLALLLIVVVISFWYSALPAVPVTDGLFLVIIAAVYLSKAFDGIYLSPIPRQSISVLGHLMLIRTAALAVLVLRGNVHAEFRFLPNRAEWLAGLRWFVPALPVVGIAYWALGLAHVRAHPLNVFQAIGTFLGILWVVALSEEFFFRGLLQQWLEGWTGSPDHGAYRNGPCFRQRASWFQPDLSELAMGHRGGHSRSVPGTRMAEFAQRSGQYGDPCADRDDLEVFLR